MHLFTKFTSYYLEELPIAVMLSISVALLIAISVLVFQRHKISYRLKNIDFSSLKVSVFFLFSSFFSFLPAALWYPAIRHLYLPGALLMMSVFILLDALNFLKNWRRNIIQNLVLVLGLLLFAFLQTNSLIQWQNRDAVRKNFYLELSEKSREFPSHTNFVIDSSSPELEKLFYAELMTSAYQYYNDVSNFERVKINQFSRTESLKICLTTQVQQLLFVEITLDKSNRNAFEYNVVPVERFCN
jgi:hypothetical protein